MNYPKILLSLDKKNNYIKYRIRSVPMRVDEKKTTHIICEPKYFIGKDWRTAIKPNAPNYESINKQLNILLKAKQKIIDDCRERGLPLTKQMLLVNDYDNFFQYYEVFLKSPEKMQENGGEGLDDSTLNHYKVVSDELKDFIKESEGLEAENLYFRNITNSFVDRLILWYLNRERYNSPNTISRKLSKIKSVEESYIQNIKRDRLQVLTKKKIKIKDSNKTSKKDHEKVLSALEIESIYALEFPQSKKKHEQNKFKLYRDLFVFMCDTGIRISCLTQLEFKDIKQLKEDGKVITVIQRDAQKKNAGAYTVAMSDRAFKIYLEYKQNPEKCDYVFPLMKYKGKHYKKKFRGTKTELKAIISAIASAFRNKLNKIVKKLDVPITYSISSHTARHSFLTSCIHDSHIPLPIIMVFSGHKKVETLMKYVHINQKSIHFDLVEKINERNER